MIKTYALETVTENPRILELPLMTLVDAEKAQRLLKDAGKETRIKNVKAE